MDRAEAAAWLRAYARAWERADPLVTELFTPGATYRSHAFREPHLGLEGIRSYWQGATATQRDVRVLIGEPLVAGDRVVAEWWTTMTEEEGPVTLPGVLLLDFEATKCRSLREYWAYTTGRHEPFPEWGEAAAGAGADEHARAWVDAYRDAWSRGDAHAAAELYSEDVVFRSHAFRKPDRGRAAVLAYTRAAFDSEAERDVRFGEPLTDGRNAAVEYWTTFTEDGKRQTLAGCVLMSFDDSGACRTSRDYWHVSDGAVDPPPEWGWLLPG